MKIQFFKKNKDFKKKDFDFNPNYYWEIIIFSVVILILLSFFFSYRLFIQINKEPVLLTQDSNGQIPKINKGRIEEVLNYFSEKEQKSAKILNSPAPAVDPSL